MSEMVTKMRTGFLPMVSEKLPKVAVPSRRLNMKTLMVTGFSQDLSHTKFHSEIMDVLVEIIAWGKKLVWFIFHEKCPYVFMIFGT